MLSPTAKLFSLRNSHHASSSSTALVCRSFLICLPSAYFFCSCTARRKKSSPSNVGSPPCQLKMTKSTSLADDLLANQFFQQLIGDSARRRPRAN